MTRQTTLALGFLIVRILSSGIATLLPPAIAFIVCDIRSVESVFTALLVMISFILGFRLAKYVEDFVDKMEGKFGLEEDDDSLGDISEFGGSDEDTKK